MKEPAAAPARGRYHHGDLRNALLEASVGLVAERGVEGFSLREAARAVGVSPAAAYRHFEDKDALLAALAHDAFGRLAQGMERAISRVQGTPGSPHHAAAVFCAVGLAYVEFSVQHPAHFRVMFGPWCAREEEAVPGGGPSWIRWAAGPRDAYTILVDSLDALVASGAVRAASRAGAEIGAWSMVHGLASLLVEGVVKLAKAERSQAMRQMARTLLAGLGCDPELLGAPEAPLETDPCARSPGARKR